MCQVHTFLKNFLILDSTFSQCVTHFFLWRHVFVLPDASCLVFVLHSHLEIIHDTQTQPTELSLMTTIIAVMQLIVLIFFSLIQLFRMEIKCLKVYNLWFLSMCHKTSTNMATSLCRIDGARSAIRVSNEIFWVTKFFTREIDYDKK
jgi:hypothetical protein